MSSLSSDVRYGLRSLVTAPAFVGIAALCLGLGIGATTMMFTAVDSVLLEPPPFVEPDRLVGIAEVRRASPGLRRPVSPGSYRVLREAGAGVAEAAAMRASAFQAGRGETPRRRNGAFATANLFPVLGIEPAFGRGFDAADEALGAPPVVLLSHEIWRTDFAGERNVIGTSLTIDGRAHTVIGVLPSLLDARVFSDIREARLWVPLQSTSSISRDDRSLTVIARLAGGVTLETAAARFGTIAEDLAARYPESNEWTLRVEVLDAAVSNASREMILLGMGAGVLVLVIACANVANLMLARGMRRRHEFAIRTAIGASHGRIVRQLLFESLVLAALGAVLGLLIARWGRDWVLRALAASHGAEITMPMDARVLAFTVGVTLLSSLLFGLVPALQVVGTSAQPTLRESGFGATTSRAVNRMRHGLVVGQVAAALALLVGAALLLSSFMNLMAVEGGIETENLLSVEMSLRERDGDAAGDPVPDVEGILAAVTEVPGVESASAGGFLPLRTSGNRSRVTLAGAGFEPDRAPTISYAPVTGRFFETLRTPLLRGRGYGEAASGDATSVAVVNERMARELWDGADPLGQQFGIESVPGLFPITVVGVSRDIANWDQGTRPLATAYIRSRAIDTFPSRLLVRTSGPMPGGFEGISNAVRSTAPGVEVVEIVTMDEVSRGAFWRQELFSSMLAVFGSGALLLAALGLYGVLAYLVRFREREIGIRIALGSGRGRVLRMVFEQGAKLVGAGVVLGLVGAYVLARLLRGLLFGVEPFDAGLFVGITAVLVAVAIAACIAPAYRATRIDPSALLRD